MVPRSSKAADSRYKSARAGTEDCTCECKLLQDAAVKNARHHKEKIFIACSQGLVSRGRASKVAMVTGVKNGWLPAKTYGPAARKAWLGLVKHINSEANVTDVCVGTNKAHVEVGSNIDTQLKYYLDRTRRTGDLHGQAPVLWTATALLR